MKYSRHRDVACIKVDCQPTDGAPAYFVKDHGAGFAMKYYDKLFGVFQRLHNADEFEGKEADWQRCGASFGVMVDVSGLKGQSI